MDETLLEILGDRLTDRIQKANVVFLTKIGESIKKIGTLTPTQAHQLIQMLKYSGDYEELISQLSSLTGIDPLEIDNIFREYSKKDLNFAKKFYEYRNIPFTPFDENIPLKMQTEALANLTKNAMTNFTRSRALGYTLNDINGVPTFYGLRETYEKVLDEALLNVAQGKETFNDSMTKIMKELGSSGLKTLDYASGRSYRLDSMVRMHLKSGLRELHNENQRLLGEEYGADGVEISVHEHPAEDHEEAQGRQFSFEEFKKLQDTGIAKDYKEKEIDMHLKNKDGDSALTHRPISEYNCYHYTFSIVLGVNEPPDEEKLQQIIDDNRKGFEYEGKHYTLYEGTQLQRQIERKIREQKDTQILAKAGGNNELINDSQLKITQLTRKYRELCNISGLPPKAERMRVSGYRRVKVDVPKVEKPKTRELKPTEIFISAKENQELAEYYFKAWEGKNSWEIRFNDRFAEIQEQMKTGFKDEIIDLSTFEGCNKLLGKINGKLYGDEIKDMDIKLVSEASKSIYQNIQRCPAWLDDSKLNYTLLSAKNLGGNTIAETQMGNIRLDTYNYKSYDRLLKDEMEQQEIHEYLGGYKNSWHSLTTKDNITLGPVTHEQGHIIQQRISGQVIFNNNKELVERFNYMPRDEYGGFKRRDVEKELIEIPIKRVMEKEGITRKEVIDKYVSQYGKTDYQEMFAETFANSQLGKSNSLGNELIEFLKEIGQWK